MKDFHKKKTHIELNQLMKNKPNNSLLFLNFYSNSFKERKPSSASLFSKIKEFVTLIPTPVDIESLIPPCIFCRIIKFPFHHYYY